MKKTTKCVYFQSIFNLILVGCATPFPTGDFEPRASGLRTLGERVDPLHTASLEHTFYRSCELFVMIQIARILKPWKRKIAMKVCLLHVFTFFLFSYLRQCSITDRYNLYKFSLTATLERAQGMWLRRLCCCLLVPCGSVLGGCIVHPKVGCRW